MKKKRSLNFPKFRIFEIIQEPIFMKIKWRWGAQKFMGYKPAQLKLNIDDKNYQRLLILLNNDPEIEFKLVPYRKRGKVFDGADFFEDAVK